MVLQISNEDLIKLAQDGDQKAFSECIENNKPLVASLINRYLIRSDDKEDLMSIGVIGLIKAIKQFNFDYNTKFSTYAVPLILGEIRRYFRDDGMIKISRKDQDIYREIQNAEEYLKSSLGRIVTLNDLHDYTNLDIEDIVLSIEAHQNKIPVSLTSSNNENELCPIDYIGIEEKETILNNIDLQYALSKLNKKERVFIKLRYFDEIKQEELAKRFNVSQVQISRMEKRIILKLRKQLTNE